MERQVVHIQDIEETIHLLSLQAEAHERLLPYAAPGSLAELDLRHKLRHLHDTLYRMRSLRNAMNARWSGVLH